MQKKKNNFKNGFTLAELLIVVAIIAVLVAIAIPTIGGQVERARQSADMANMRAAEAAAIAEYLSTGEAGAYYFDINTGVASMTVKPSHGYGKSSEDASTFWPGDNASGVPNLDGDAQYVTVEIDENGNVSLLWGSLYGGKYTKAAATYSSLSTPLTAETAQERLYADQDAMRAVASKFLGMTVDEILAATGNPSYYSGRLTRNDDKLTLFTYRTNADGSHPEIRAVNVSMDTLAELGFDTSGLGGVHNSFTTSSNRALFSDFANSGKEVNYSIGRVKTDPVTKEVIEITVWAEENKGSIDDTPAELKSIVVTK